MKRLYHVLEEFYFHAAPLGVSFVSPKLSSGLAFGRSSAKFDGMLGSVDGFIQEHLENLGISVFLANFGWSELLIVQFPYLPEEPELVGPWLRFVRLSAAIARYLEDPSESPEPPPPGIGARQPTPGLPPAKPRVASEPLPEDELR